MCIDLYTENNSTKIVNTFSTIHLLSRALVMWLYILVTQFIVIFLDFDKENEIWSEVNECY